MDPLSLAATVVGLVATCAHVAKRIRELYAEIQGAPDALEQLALEAEVLAQSLGRLTTQDPQTGETRVKISRIESGSDLQLTLNRVFQSCKSTLDSVGHEIDKASGLEHQDDHNPGNPHQHGKGHGHVHIPFSFHKHGHRRKHEKSENWDLDWVWDTTAGRAIDLIDNAKLRRTVRKLNDYLLPLRSHRNNLSFLISILVLESSNDMNKALKQGGNRIRQIEHDYAPFRIQLPSLLMPGDHTSQVAFPMASAVSPSAIVDNDNDDAIKVSTEAQLPIPERKHRISWSGQEASEPVGGALRRCLSNATRVAHVSYTVALPSNESQAHQGHTPTTPMPLHSQSEPNPRVVNIPSSPSQAPLSRPPFPNPSLKSTSSYDSYDSVDSHSLSILHTPPDDSNLSGVNIFVWPGSDEGGLHHSVSSGGNWPKPSHPGASATHIMQPIGRISDVGHRDHHINKPNSLAQTNTSPGWRIGL